MDFIYVEKKGERDSSKSFVLHKLIGLFQFNKCTFFLKVFLSINGTG